MFNLIDMPRPSKPVRGSPQLFKSVFFDKHFSRIRPWHVLALWVPVISYLLYLTLTRGVSVLSTLGLLFLGAITWTLIEYGLHRYLFHWAPPASSKFLQQMMFLIHGVHHDYPWDPDRLVIPPLVSGLIGAVLWLPTKWVFGAPMHYSYFAGIVLGYVIYDIGHYAWHNLKPRTALGRYLRSYHLVHHFKTPLRRYGVSSPVWDYVFGTAPEENESASSATLSTTKP